MSSLDILCPKSMIVEVNSRIIKALIAALFNSLRMDYVNINNLIPKFEEHSSTL